LLADPPENRLDAIAVGMLLLLGIVAALVVIIIANTPTVPRPDPPPSSSTSISAAAPIEVERTVPLRPSRGTPRAPTATSSTTRPTPATTASTSWKKTTTIASTPVATNRDNALDWPALRQCENRRQCQLGDCYRSAPGDHYRGAYQFDLRTWASVGGAGDPAAAPPAEQDARALELYRRSGRRPWPACGGQL
jgi:hypothetical protein